MSKRKNSAAAELGRKGGMARVKKGVGVLTPEQRSERAKAAAAARWKDRKQAEA